MSNLINELQAKQDSLVKEISNYTEDVRHPRRVKLVSTVNHIAAVIIFLERESDETRNSATD